MDLLNKLGVVSLLLTIIALFLVGEKEAVGWPIFLASYVIQIYVFYKTKQKFLVVQMIVLSFFAIYNYSKWLGG